MIQFTIIDDDTQTLENISNMLESIFFKYDYDAEVSYKTSHVDKLFSYLENNKVDVLILDITLKSNITGIEIAERIRKYNKDCYFIFITAYLEYGIVAYKYKTFDFIAKPVQEERLEDCIVRLFNDINGSSKKFIKLENKHTIIAEDDVKYIERDGMKIVFHTESRDYEVYSSFNKLQKILPTNFIRCHKSFIVNINNISKVDTSENTIFFNTSYCDIGPKYKNDFLEVISHS